MWTRSRGLREPLHCAQFYYSQAGIQERSTPASPGSTGRRWARQAAWAGPGPGQTQPVRRLPEFPDCKHDTAKAKNAQAEILKLATGMSLRNHCPGLPFSASFDRAFSRS